MFCRWHHKPISVNPTVRERFGEVGPRIALETRKEDGERTAKELGAVKYIVSLAAARYECPFHRDKGLCSIVLVSIVRRREQQQRGYNGSTRPRKPIDVADQVHTQLSRAEQLGTVTEVFSEFNDQGRSNIEAYQKLLDVANEMQMRLVDAQQHSTNADTRTGYSSQTRSTIEAYQNLLNMATGAILCFCRMNQPSAVANTYTGYESRTKRTIKGHQNLLDVANQTHERDL